MFSAVVLSMWKTERVFKLLNDLNESELVNEIILVNNAPGKEPKDLTDKYNKLVIESPKENIYINPAWNRAIARAKSEYVCTIGDDWNPPIDDLFNFVAQTSDLLGIMGINRYSNFETPHLTIGQNIGTDWGGMMFFKKEDYIPIPPQLKLWYGDDWMYKSFFPKVYTINLKVEADTSQTTTSPELQEQINKDVKYWKKFRY